MMEKYDLLIIGSGCSGMTAALRAWENGLKNICILEKAGLTGGNSNVAGCMFSIGGRVQKEQGFEVEPKAFLKSTLEDESFAANTELVKKFIANTGEAADWLHDLGVTLMYTPRGEGSVFETTPQHCALAEGASNSHAYLGYALVRRMTALCQERGIEIKLNTRAKELTMEAGKVTGVIAETKEGTVEYSAKAVIIACGGVCGTMESMAKYFPHLFKPQDVRFTLGVVHCTGDGIEMAEKAGAETGRYMNMMLKGPCHLGYGGTQALAVNGSCLYVNKYGRRFCNEATPTLNAMQRQSEKRAFAIAPQSVVKEMAAKLPPQPRPGTNGPVVGLEEGLAIEDGHGRYTKICDTLEEAAQFMNCDLAELTATVEQYNAACAAGQDDDMFKDARNLVPITAPYYILAIGCSTDSTQGGIKIDTNFRVLTYDDQVIEGLYAIGDNASGFVSFTKYGPTGCGFTWSLNSGYMAGTEIAKTLAE